MSKSCYVYVFREVRYFCLHMLLPPVAYIAQCFTVTLSDEQNSLIRWTRGLEATVALILVYDRLRIT